MITDLSPDQQIVEDEIVFVDIPELSRFEIFEGMKVMIENIENDEKMDFELVVQPLDNPEQESMTLKLQGKNMETVGTCLFFADTEPTNKDSSDGKPKTGINENHLHSDLNDDKDVEMSDQNRANSSSEIKPHSETQNRESNIVNDGSKSKLVCIGKCKKVVQAFIED
ncbi:hypothetical protein CPCDC_8g120 [Cryptosporidium sp. 43IA8]|nr:hypothetical protein CPCDC_8g120 [Cryptosporidium sp. 43IA8]